MQECKGIAGRLFGHNYTAVYDTVPPTADAVNALEGTMVTPWHLASVLETMSKSLYQGHVSSRCGNRVRRIERV